MKGALLSLSISCPYLLRWHQVILCALQTLQRLRIHVVVVVSVWVMAPGILQEKKKGGGGLIHKGAYRSRQSCLPHNLCLHTDVASAIHTPFVQHVSSAIHCSRKRTQNKPWSQMNFIPKQYNTEDVPLPLAEPGEFQINFSSWFLLSEIWSYI